MALTRAFLKAMGLTDEQVTSIIEAHTETVDGLKAERDSFKADAEKLPGVQQKLDDANKTIEANGKDSWKVKYDAVKEDFDNFKKDLTAKQTKEAKENAYRGLLKEVGVAEKRIESVLKVTDLSNSELGEDGKFKDAEALTNSIRSEWSDFIVTHTEGGVQTSNPPAGGNSGSDYDTMSDADYYKATYEAAKRK